MTSSEAEQFLRWEDSNDKIAITKDITLSNLFFFSIFSIYAHKYTNVWELDTLTE